MKPVRTGIIGCGKVAHIHAAALRDLPESQFTAVCGRTLSNTQTFAQQYGVQAFDDLATFARESGVEAVCICTPHPQHATAAEICAQAGIHVLIEKPLASSLADCDRILSAAKKSGVKVGTMCQRRFYAPCRRIKDAIVEGKIGKPILGSVTMYGWRDQKYYESDAWRGSWAGEGGGVLVNQAPHQLDLLLWYMGPVAEVSGYWANLNHPYIEVEDTAVASVRFQSGAVGQILVTNSANPALYGRVQVNGSNGASVGVQTDGGSMFIAGMSKITEPPFNDVWTIAGEESLRAPWQTQDTEFFNSIDPIANYHTLQIQDFLQAIQHGTDPAITGEDGRRTVELFAAIYESTRISGPVRFPVGHA